MAASPKKLSNLAMFNSLNEFYGSPWYLLKSPFVKARPAIAERGATLSAFSRNFGTSYNLPARRNNSIS